MKFNLKAIGEFGKTVLKFAEKHSPTIFTVVGVGLMIGATVKAIVEAPEAKDEIDELEDAEVSHQEYNKTKFKIIAKHYWPVVLMSVGGAGMIFWGHKVSLGRTAAAIAAYQMSKDDLKKLEEKITEVDGEKHLDQLKHDILKDEVGAGPAEGAMVYNTGHGMTLFYDPIGKRFFHSDIEHIRKMTAKLNFELAEQMKYGKCSVASLNDWCDMIGLERLDGAINGRKIGPNVGKDLGWRNRLIDLKFDSMLLPNDTHCTVVGFTESGGPKWDLDISDDYGCYEDLSSIDDDSTDSKWRGI